VRVGNPSTAGAQGIGVVGSRPQCRSRGHRRMTCVAPWRQDCLHLRNTAEQPRPRLPHKAARSRTAGGHVSHIRHWVGRARHERSVTAGDLDWRPPWHRHPTCTPGTGEEFAARRTFVPNQAQASSLVAGPLQTPHVRRTASPRTQRRAGGPGHIAYRCKVSITSESPRYSARRGNARKNRLVPKQREMYSMSLKSLLAV